MATSHVSDTLQQQQEAGGTSATLADVSIDHYVLCAGEVLVGFAVGAAPSPDGLVLVGFAVGAAPSPEGLVLSDPASNCVGYAAVALRLTASGRSYMCRAFVYYLLNEYSKKSRIFFLTDLSEKLCIFNIHFNT